MCDLRHCISSFPIFTSTFVSLHLLYSVCFYLSGNHVFLKLVFISLTFHLFLLLALQLRTMQFSLLAPPLGHIQQVRLQPRYKDKG